jgi:hypothetical protein
VNRPYQQINLYQPEAVQERDPFGADTFALVGSAVVCALAIMWGLGARGVDRLQRAVENLQRQQVQQQQQLSTLGALVVASGKPSDLESRIAQLRGELAAREQALALLRAGVVGRTSGFSQELAALARHPVPGLWLRHVTLSGVTGSVSLAGEVVEPARVPRYLHALATEAAFSGLRFDGLAIDRPPPPKGPQTKEREIEGPRPHPSTFKFRVQGTSAAPTGVAEAKEGQP